MAEETKLPIRTGPKASIQPQSPVFGDLRREIDRIFDGFQMDSWRFPFGRSALETDLRWPRLADIAPAIDVAEKPSAFELTAELPGIDEKDIDVRLSNNTLTIKGEKKEAKEQRDKDYYVSERRYGSFARSFVVPPGVDTSKIEANFSKGVLTITLPKSAEAQKSEKRIEVNAA